MLNGGEDRCLIEERRRRRGREECVERDIMDFIQIYHSGIAKFAIFFIQVMYQEST